MFKEKMRREFLPEYILHLPTVFMLMYFCIKARDLLFFTRCSIDYTTGDIANSSKYKSLYRLDSQYIPKTVLIMAGDTTFVKKIEEAGLSFPIIVKPDIGKRGLGVIYIDSLSHLTDHMKSIGYDVLIQEYISYSNEAGIFYYRFPEKTDGTIASIGLKSYLTVIGDGISSVSELLEKKSIPKKIIAKLSETYDLTYCPGKESKFLVERIGSHNRGTLIVSGNHLIDDRLTKEINKAVAGVDYLYGRMDVKFDSIEKLVNGEFKILELNTITSEPLVVYDESIRIVEKYRIIYNHLKYMYTISMKLKKTGRRSLRIKDFAAYLSSYKKHLQLLTPKT